jgi:hypothetical protein
MRKVILGVLIAVFLTVNANATVLFIDERTIFDEFFNTLSKDDTRARWDNLGQALRDQPNMIGWVFSYAGRDESRCESMLNLKELRDYLVKKRKIPRNRLMLIDGGYRERGTTIMYLDPKDSKFPPTAYPTLTSIDILN